MKCDNNHKSDKHCNTSFCLGATGQAGRTGDRGPTGETGIQGIQGLPGADGAAGEQVLNMAVIYDTFSAPEPPERLVQFNTIYYAVKFAGDNLFSSAGTNAITHSTSLNSEIIQLASGYYLVSYNITVGSLSDELNDAIYEFGLINDYTVIASSLQGQYLDTLDEAKAISATCIVKSEPADPATTTSLRLVLINPIDNNVIERLGIYSASITIFRLEDVPTV